MSDRVFPTWAKRRGAAYALMLIALCTLGVAPAAAGESKPDEAPSRYLVQFRDRSIDLEPFLLGYPYSRVTASGKAGKLLYFDTRPEGKWLCVLDLPGHGEVDLTRGRRVGMQDWALRSFGEARFRTGSELCYITSDEANDEHLNVYSIDLLGGALDQITRNEYTYAWDFSEDGRLLAYVRRDGAEEPFSSRLMLRDMETGAERELLCDGGGADRFTWSHIAFTPDNKALILLIQHDGSRRHCSLARIDLAAPSLDYLIPPRVDRLSLELLRGWVDTRSFVYRSAEEGFDNLYLYDLQRRESRRLTDYREAIGESRLLGTEPATILAPIKRPHETELQLLDARSGELLARKVIAASAGIKDAHGAEVILALNSHDTPLRIERLAVRKANERWSLDGEPLAEILERIRERIVHVKTEKVSYPTFDRDESGERRMLHAFYHEALREPVRPEDRLVRIIAFYGGGNYYSTSTQIMGAAGIATFSPSPRGSHGFGAEFRALNDKDLGGDEIVDIIYAAKWLVEEKGYEPWQIGVTGGSHGGYAVMRALTFPPETNGRNESFDFGFGHSHAGFCDITTFFETCNIPDWVILECGDPVSEREKLLERSPISHIERLNAPLLLTHGTNDWRVPVTESRRFAAAARELGRPVTLVEFPGQGHGINGLDNKLVYYQSIMDFLAGLEKR